MPSSSMYMLIQLAGVGNETIMSCYFCHLGSIEDQKIPRTYREHTDTLLRYQYTSQSESMVLALVLDSRIFSSTTMRVFVKSFRRVRQW